MKIRMTIFKKTFLILLVCFTMINILNIMLDFQITKANRIIQLDNKSLQTYIAHLAGQFNKKYRDLDNQEFLKMIDQEIQKDYNGLSYNTMVIDNNYQLIQQKGGLISKNNEIKIEVEIEEIEPDGKVTYTQFFNVSSKKLIQAIEKSELLNGKFIEIELAYQEDHKHPDVLTYLSIAGKTMYGNKPKKDIKKAKLIGFQDQRYSLSLVQETVKDMNLNTYTRRLTDYNQLNQFVLQELKDDEMNYFDSQNQYYIMYGYSVQLENKGNLYQVYQIPLLKENVPYNIQGYYQKEDYLGSLVFCLYEQDAIASIKSEVIDNKILLYVISFGCVIILCILLSYTISKRIKRIDKETSKIAQYDFDVYLDENSQDELGTLSHHINIMNENLKTTIENLNKEIEQVKKLESLRQEFIANFTHEIKTPLGIIEGYIELVQDTSDDKKKKEYLLLIDKEVERINQLVQAMLNLSKLETGHVELEIQDIDFNELLITVIDSMMTLIQKKDIQMVIEGEDLTIQADVSQFETVISNFLSNAIKHTPQHGHIYIRYDEKHISIENEGSTLTPQQMENIWETYVSGDREGTGLGLAICKSILNLHHFQYSVFNTEKGVCFDIQI